VVPSINLLESFINGRLRSHDLEYFHDMDARTSLANNLVSLLL
jgi:hypothetical protein